MAPSNQDIVLYHYTYSPYARRIVWYLTLRGLEYTQCLQAPVWPREDILALGVNYRRIPIMTVGRDVYCDTRLMLRKLEQQFPEGSLGARRDDHKAIERLLDKWIIEGGVFARASSLIPTNLPAMKDPVFLKDRGELTGRSWNKEGLEKGRPEAVAAIREAFHLLETTLLADGRDWILQTDKPSLADIEAIWPFDWLIGMNGALPASVISDQHFPKVYAWVQRFKEALKAAKSSAPKAKTLKGHEATQKVLGSDFAETSVGFDESDPLGLRKGMEVEVYPTDSGFSHRQRGQLIGLTRDEVIVSSTSKAGDKEVRIHMPRTGFRIVVAGAKL